MTERKILNAEQDRLVLEFTTNYGLSANQISFENESPEPIFDYEALCVLRLRLTDLQDISYWIAERNMELGIVTAQCSVILSDNRTVSDLGSAQIGEPMPDGKTIENLIQAQNVALARAFRRGIRAAGINLVKAHKEYLQSGKVQSGNADAEFQSKTGAEIHKLATEWGHIKGRDKTLYQNFIENVFGVGKCSSLDLTEVEKSQLVAIYRNMLNSRNLANLPKAA